MKKTTITLEWPEFKAGLNALNAYIAQQLGYSYRPKRERSPKEKWKRALRWKFWQTQLKWMNKYLDYVIDIKPTDWVSVWGECLFDITLTNKSTGAVEEKKDLHQVQARRLLHDYQLEASRIKHSNQNTTN